MFDVFLHSTQHVWFENFVESLYLLLGGKVAEVSSEIIEASEFLRMNVVEETPKLPSVVLNGSSGQEKNSFTGQFL